MSVIFRNISAEGAAFGEVEINQQNPWASLYQVYQNKLIKRAKVDGLEKFSFDGREEEWSLVVFFETPDETIRGIIPKVASGFHNRKQMERAVGRQLVFMVKSVDKENGFCILDRVAALEKMKNITLKTVKKEDTRTGVVEHVTRVYAILNIGGVTAVLNRHQFSHDATNDLDLTDFLSKGDQLEVKITSIREKITPEEQVRKTIFDVSRKAVLANPKP